MSETQVVRQQSSCTSKVQHAIGDEAATSISAILKALADPLRLRMLSAVALDPRGESCVCDLAELADVAQPTVSHHLKVLKDAGLLDSERRGTWVWYRVHQSRKKTVESLLEAFAPTVVSGPSRPQADLERSGPIADQQLDLIAEELCLVFQTIDPDLVFQTVRESYTGLLRSGSANQSLESRTRAFATQRLQDMSRNRDGALPQVLFVCTQNAGRSQIAAALLNQLSNGQVVARSAGSAPAAEIHPNVVPILEQIGGGDVSDLYPKPLTDDAVRGADVVIKLGCGDVCPSIAGVRYEDWPVGDPALATPSGLAGIHEDLNRRVVELIDSLIS